MSGWGVVGLIFLIKALIGEFDFRPRFGRTMQGANIWEAVKALIANTIFALFSWFASRVTRILVCSVLVPSKFAGGFPMIGRFFDFGKLNRICGQPWVTNRCHLCHVWIAMELCKGSFCSLSTGSDVKPYPEISSVQ